MPVTPYPPIDTDVSDPPNRGQEQAVFSPKMDAFLAAFQPLKVEQNALGAWTNSTADQVEIWANEAEASKSLAAASESVVVAVSNYKGQWASLSGALNKPATVGNLGAFWVLNNNLANVALSEPSPTNPDWSFVSGTRWLSEYTASFTLIPNSYTPISATIGAVNAALDTMAAGDFVVVQNSPASTQPVTVTNSIYTIRGKIGGYTIPAGTDITMRAGDTVHFRCVSPTILEVL